MKESFILDLFLLDLEERIKSCLIDIEIKGETNRGMSAMGLEMGKHFNKIKAGVQGK